MVEKFVNYSLIIQEGIIVLSPVIQSIVLYIKRNDNKEQMPMAINSTL